MIQKAFGNNAVSVVQINCGTNTSKMVKNLLKVIHILGGLQYLRMLKGIWTAMNKDQQLTVQELAANLVIPKTTESKILMQNLGMKYVVAKFILQLLLPEQKEHHAAVANDLIQPLPMNQFSSRSS